MFANREGRFIWVAVAATRRNRIIFPEDFTEYLDKCSLSGRRLSRLKV